MATLIQKTYRGFKARKLFNKERAATRIQLAYRKYRSNKWMRQVVKTFANVRQQEKLGKHTPWPQPPSVLQKACTLLQKIHNTWMAKQLIKKLSEEDTHFVKQKIVTYDTFTKNKAWNVPRKYDADYLASESNKTREQYDYAVKTLFQKFGDDQILFADYVDKLNRKAKIQRRVFIVTEKNLYKQDPKSYKVKKTGVPLVSVTGISLTKFEDRWVIIHCSGEHRDLAINTSNEGDEKYSELVTVLLQAVESLTNKKIEVKFYETPISFNNSRKKGMEGKPGSLTFEKAGPEVPKGFKKGKNENHIINY